MALSIPSLPEKSLTALFYSTSSLDNFRLKGSCAISKIFNPSSPPTPTSPNSGDAQSLTRVDGGSGGHAQWQRTKGGEQQGQVSKKRGKSLPEGRTDDEHLCEKGFIKQLHTVQRSSKKPGKNETSCRTPHPKNPDSSSHLQGQGSCDGYSYVKYSGTGQNSLDSHPGSSICWLQQTMYMCLVSIPPFKKKKKKGLSAWRLMVKIRKHDRMHICQRFA